MTIKAHPPHPHMTKRQRDAFLKEKRVAVLSVARPGRGPFAIPIWYDYRGGRIYMETNPNSLHGRQMRRAQRATLTVQDERPPYKYVTVEGPVTFEGVSSESFIRKLARRYLGARAGDAFMLKIYPAYAGSSHVAVLTPEAVWSVDRAF